MLVVVKFNNYLQPSFNEDNAQNKCAKGVFLV